MKRFVLATVCLVMTVGGTQGATLRIDSLKSPTDTDDYADNGDTVFVSGGGWSGTRVTYCVTRQYEDLSNIRDSAPSDSSFTFDAGGTSDSLYGWLVLSGVPKNDGIDSIRVGLQDNDFGSMLSSNYQKVDDVAPAAPTIFSVSAQGALLDSARFLWQGAGDNGSSGTAVACTIKFARYLINNEQRWDSAYTYALPCAEPAPLTAASLQTFYCDMYDYGDSTYYYAIKFEDNMGYSSSLKYYSSGVNTKPVELSSFSAVMVDGAVTLAWRTESETDNAKWRLERSSYPNGGNPVVVYAIRKDAATYTTNFPTDYEYTDRDVTSEGTYYYTLYDISLDGRETAHGPVSTDGIAIFNGRVADEPLVLNACEPNPVRYRTTFSFAVTSRAFDGASMGRVAVEISSMDGRVSYSVLDRTVSIGEYGGIAWDRERAEPGVYIVRLSTDTHSVTRRLMVVGR